MLHITRRHLAPVALTAAAALCGAALAPPGAAAQATGHGAASASATDTTVLRQWNLRAQGIAIGLRPSAHGQSRGMAMVQGAVYDAVTAIDPTLPVYEPRQLDDWISVSLAPRRLAMTVLSGLPSLRLFGWLSAFAMVAALFADLFMLRPIAMFLSQLVRRMSRRSLLRSSVE